MHGENDRDEELRKLREEIEALRENLNRISGALDASEEPQPREQVEVPIETPEETGEPEEPPKVREPWEEEEEGERYRRPRRRDFDFRFDFGDRLGDYIGGFVEDVMEGVASEIEHSLFVHPRGMVVMRKRSPRQQTRASEKEAASVMSALGNENRVKILDALSSGGLYAGDLQEALGEISPSTLSSHLDVLEEAGLILQERRRGRYLITIPGRLAIKMAYQIAERTVPGPPDE